MKKILFICAICIIFASCEKPVLPEDEGNVTFDFGLTQKDITRATVTLGDYFEKMNMQLFDADGNKVFEQVKTQTREDANFGHVSCMLSEGSYTVVAVGHSSIRSATIKSPFMVQFTASDGEKLTDTFCYCGQIEVGENEQHHDFVMNRTTALVQFHFTDLEVPASFAYMVIEYTGGSANFNPTTSLGCTKSTQSEQRQANDQQLYQVYTFPYMAVQGTLKMTLSAYDIDGNTIRRRTFDAVPVTRNRITNYSGPFFEPGDGQFTQTGFGFLVNGEWEGIDEYTF